MVVHGTVGVIIKFPFRFCYRSVFSGVTVFVTVCHRLQPFRFLVVLLFLLPSVTVYNISVLACSAN